MATAKISPFMSFLLLVCIFEAKFASPLGSLKYCEIDQNRSSHTEFSLLDQDLPQVSDPILISLVVLLHTRTHMTKNSSKLLTPRPNRRGDKESNKFFITGLII